MKNKKNTRKINKIVVLLNYNHNNLQESNIYGIPYVLIKE